ncbi:MAG: amidohydrolase family protein [Acidobacteria bacterium]|nr:amidohydrolase family protein [Acidobacteriota bacterium]
MNLLRVVCVLLLSLLVCGATATTALAQNMPRYVDAHLHYEDRPNFFEDLVRVYRKNNAVACVLAGREDFDKLKAAAKQYPDVVIPFLWIELDDSDVLDQIDRAHLAGFKGLKIHSPLKNYDDPSYFPIFARAERYHLVALLHTGISFRPANKVPSLKGSMARMRPMYLDTLARAFPELILIGAHLGNPWYDEAAEVARWNPNVFFDLTGSSMTKKKDDLSVFRKYLWWGQSSSQAHMPENTPNAFEKLVFGTDEDPKDLEKIIAQYNQMLDACQVPEAVRRKIFAETMARILGLGEVKK